MENYTLSPLWRRFVAFLADFFCIQFIFTLVILPFLQTIGFTIPKLFFEMDVSQIKISELLEYVQKNYPVFLPFQIIILCFSAIYFVFLESSPWQATLGKRWLSLQVVSDKGFRLTPFQALLRISIKLLTLVFYYAFIFIFLNPKRQFFHDWVAKTNVVNKKGSE